MRATLLQGMAFMTVVYDDLTPAIDQDGAILAPPAGTHTGTNFTVWAV